MRNSRNFGICCKGEETPPKKVREIPQRHRETGGTAATSSHPSRCFWTFPIALSGDSPLHVHYLFVGSANDRRWAPTRDHGKPQRLRERTECLVSLVSSVCKCLRLLWRRRRRTANEISCSVRVGAPSGFTSSCLFVYSEAFNEQILGLHRAFYWNSDLFFSWFSNFLMKPGSVELLLGLFLDFQSGKFQNFEKTLENVGIFEKIPGKMCQIGRNYFENMKIEFLCSFLVFRADFTDKSEKLEKMPGKPWTFAKMGEFSRNRRKKCQIGRKSFKMPIIERKFS